MRNLLHIFSQVENCPDDSLNNPSCTTILPEVTANSTTLQAILEIVFGTLTAVAILVIVIQGVRFILSSGDPDKAATARKGVIYALVGLVVVFSADIIVFVVLDRI